MTNSVREERLRLPTTGHFVESILLFQLQCNSVKQWSGVFRDGSKEEFRQFNQYMAKVKAGAVSPLEQLQNSLADPFVADCMHWECSPDDEVRSVAGFKEDMSDAYGSIPCMDPSGATTGFWDPVLCKWRFAQLHACSFGNSRSVYAYSRLMAAIIFLCQKIFLLPVKSYVDDVVGFERLATSVSASTTLHTFLSLFGQVAAHKSAVGKFD